MMISQDMEILRTVAIAKHSFTRQLFSNAKQLYCPVCGDNCPIFQDIIRRRTLIFCRRCHTEFSCNILSSAYPNKEEESILEEE